MTAKKARKLRRLEDAPKLIPPVSSTMKKRRIISQTKKDGNHVRTAMRRLLTRKLAVITPDMVDKNTPAFKSYQRVIEGITSDLGGKRRLTSIQQVLINAFSAATIRLADLTARQLLGDNSVLQQKGFAQTVAALVRLADSLGVQHRPTKELPSLSAYLGRSNGKDTIDAEVLE